MDTAESEPERWVEHLAPFGPQILCRLVKKWQPDWITGMSPIDEIPELGPDTHSSIPTPVIAPSLQEINYEQVEKADKIGAGGNADVFHARISVDGTEYPIAVKEPRFQGTIHATVVEQFEEEANTWRSLSDHDNIVTVYDWGANPVPWIALEFMDGGELTQKLGTVELLEALWLGGRIVEGIRHGHRHGIAHLDLKPANVLLRQTNTETWPYPKITDWGLAKLMLEHSTSIEGVTPHYGAPEQFDPDSFGSPDDFTDIYQLGAIIYALLTGDPPFTGPPRTVMQNVLNTEPDPPSTKAKDVPPAVDDVVLKALSKDKSDRYTTVVDLRRELDRLFFEQMERSGERVESEVTGGASYDTRGDRSRASTRAGSGAGTSESSTAKGRYTEAEPGTGDPISDRSSGDTNPVTEQGKEFDSPSGSTPLWPLGIAISCWIGATAIVVGGGAEWLAFLLGAMVIGLLWYDARLAVKAEELDFKHSWLVPLSVVVLWIPAFLYIVYRLVSREP